MTDETSVAALIEATTRLLGATGELRTTARALRRRGARVIRSDLVEELCTPLPSVLDGLPSPEIPRELWGDADVLLAAAYRLADLADTLPSTGETDPAGLATALTAASSVLDIPAGESPAR